MILGEMGDQEKWGGTGENGRKGGKQGEKGELGEMGKVGVGNVREFGQKTWSSSLSTVSLSPAFEKKGMQQHWSISVSVFFLITQMGHLLGQPASRYPLPFFVLDGDVMNILESVHIVHGPMESNTIEQKDKVDNHGARTQQ